MSVVGSIRRDPEKPEFDLTDYRWLIEQWLAERSEHVGAETARGYAQKIHYFSDWWAKVGANHQWRISEARFEEFEAWLRLTYRTWKGKPLAFNTRHDAIRRLREMLKWAYDREITSINLAKWVCPAEGAPPTRKAATPDQLQREVIRLAGLGDVIDACHQLRRNYSHYWMKSTEGPAAADFLRRNLGHKNFSQTVEYTMLAKRK